MAQPDKYVSCVLDDEKYLFVLNHEGRWAAEDLLDKEWPWIAFQYDRGLLGTRIQVAVVFALTRKHHRRELTSGAAVVGLLDQVEAAPEDEQVDFQAAMHAAMTGRPKKEVLEELRRIEREAQPGEDLDDEADGDPDAEEAEEDPKAEDPETDPEPSKTTGRRSRSRSGAGKGSSKKE